MHSVQRWRRDHQVRGSALSPRSCFGHTVVLALAEKASLGPEVKQAGQSASPLCHVSTGLMFPRAGIQKGLAHSLQASSLVSGELNCQMSPKTWRTGGLCPALSGAGAPESLGHPALPHQSHGNSPPLLLHLTPLLSLVGPSGSCRWGSMWV